MHWDAIETGLPGVIFKVWDGWFVGQDVSYRWNGTTLEPMESAGRLLTVRGRGEDDVWAVGGLTGPLVVQHKDGAWVEQDTSGLDQPINGIWTDEGEDIWVAGNYGTMAHWDGTRWLRPSEPLTTDHLHAVWQHGDSEETSSASETTTASSCATEREHSVPSLWSAPIDKDGIGAGHDAVPATHHLARL